MIAKLLRRAALFSGIFLISMSMVEQSALAAPKPTPPGGHLNITEVLVDDPDNPTSITINGEDFDFGPGPLVVTLGEFGSLSIISATGTEIVATLPPNIPNGDFLLTVSTGNGQSQNDEYDLTIGAAIGPQGEKGDKGDTGTRGPKGDTGDTGSQGAQGKIGPQGPAGPVAAIGTSCPAGQAVVGMDASGNFICEAFTPLPLPLCDSVTDVVFGGKCYYLDGSNGVCQTGDVLAPQSILNSIAAGFVGKTYKTTQSNNCCIKHANQATELQDWGMGSGACNTPGPFITGPVLGGAGCTNANNNNSKQLTICQSP